MEAKFPSVLFVPDTSVGILTKKITARQSKHSKSSKLQVNIIEGGGEDWKISLQKNTHFPQ